MATNETYDGDGLKHVKDTFKVAEDDIAFKLAI